MAETRIIVLDDDPTGSQTVHGCLLLTRWDRETLQAALSDAAPLFFVLTNTRGMSAARAAETTRQVCLNLRRALETLAAKGRVIQPLLVSRSDSTLRGHYPVETDVIAETLGPFDAHFLVPAFFEGGRITRDSVHYLLVEGTPVPVHETEFARDAVFGFQHSYLPAYVEEKTGSRLPAAKVERFLLAEVRGDLADRLAALSGNVPCVVDGECQADLDNFARQIHAAAARGKRFLFRSGASLLTALADLPPQPVAPEAMAHYVRDGRPGAVIVGSHVEKSSRQLATLLKQPGTLALELDVERIAGAGKALVNDLVARCEEAHRAGNTPVVFTSRTEKRFATRGERLAFGERVSACLMELVRRLPTTLGYLISKGGITSNDVLSSALALRTARVVGQVLPGCSVVRCPADHPRFPLLPVVIFPGNVGDEEALVQVYRRLAPPGPPQAERTGTQ